MPKVTGGMEPRDVQHANRSTPPAWRWRSARIQLFTSQRLYNAYQKVQYRVIPREGREDLRVVYTEGSGGQSALEGKEPIARPSRTQTSAEHEATGQESAREDEGEKQALPRQKKVLTRICFMGFRTRA